jgi:hypothetical protein
MKNFRRGFFFAIIIIAALLGCKKEITEETSVVEQETVIQKLKSWNDGLSAELKSHRVQIQDIVTTVTEVPDWSEAKFYVDKNMVIAPIKIGDAKSAAPVFKYLVAKSNAKGEITDVNYYKIFSDNNSPADKFLSVNDVDLLSTVISNKNIPVDYTGRILKYNSSNKLLTTNYYENGELKNTEGDKQNDLDGVVLPTAPPECYSVTVDSWWVTSLNGVIISWEYLYSTTYTNCNSGGGGSGSNPPATDSIVGSVNDNYIAVCPANFDFTGSTTGNLWQGAGIYGLHCDLSFHDLRSNTSFTKSVAMPTLYVEMQYKNQSGGVVFTPAQAKAKAAAAINRGDFEVRQYFKTHPYASTFDLQSTWLSGANEALKATTYGLGTVSGSISHSYPTVILNDYLSGCVAY